jgi:hypothetical protein
MNGPTFGQGCLLVVAGAAMVFFGCLARWVEAMRAIYRYGCSSSEWLVVS